MSDDDDPVASHLDLDLEPDDPERESLSEKGSRRRQTRIEQDAAEADLFWQQVLAEKVGRRELWRLIGGTAGAHAFETRFPAGPVGFPDANAAWYERGQQDFGLRLYHELLRRDPTAVALMHAENDPRFAERERKRKRSP